MPVEHSNIKTWLHRYSELLNDANRLYDRADAIRDRLRNPHASNLSGMPHPTGFVEDRMGAVVAQIDELERDASEAMTQATAARHEIEAAVKQIKAGHWADKRTVLRCRYIDLMTWSDIAEFLFGDHPKYWDTPETFIRRAYKIHGQALDELGKYVPLDVGQENNT